ncbi:MAG TPA: chemotaxis protein CheW, partial [Lachnospiraceae bacterium]|nr:chemotaxis protein CheW [Lachnospiraceae bacterium]
VQNINTALASPIPIENRQELTNLMLSLEDGTVVLLLDCEAVIRGSL